MRYALPQLDFIALAMKDKKIVSGKVIQLTDEMVATLKKEQTGNDSKMENVKNKDQSQQLRAEEIAEMTLLAAEEVRHFGIVPKIALLSRSNFGTSDSPTAMKMREAVHILADQAPDLEVDGEMHADAALSESIRKAVLPDSRLSGQANLLIMPNVDAANIAYNLLKMLGGGVTLGPILVGAAKSVHVVTQSATVRGLVNMSALAVAGIRVKKPD